MLGKHNTYPLFDQTIHTQSTLDKSNNFSFESIFRNSLETEAQKSKKFVQVADQADIEIKVLDAKAS